MVRSGATGARSGANDGAGAVRPRVRSVVRTVAIPVAGVALLVGVVCAAVVVVALAGAGREVLHLLSAAAEVGGDTWLTQCLHCTGESPSAAAAGTGGGGGAGGPAGPPAGVTPEGCEEVLSQKESVGRVPGEGELQGRNVLRTLLTALGIRVGAGLSLMGASAAQTNAKGLLTIKCARRVEDRTLSGRQMEEALNEAYR